MNCFSTMLAIVGFCLMTVSGANNVSTTGESPTTDKPSLYPVPIGEAPITTISAPEYPDAICASIVLRDTIDKVYYDLDDYLSTNGFVVQSGHSYQLALQVHSDGDPIEDIELAVSNPEYAPDGSCVTFWLTASNRTTTQTLMIAQIRLMTENGAPSLGIWETSVKMWEKDIYVGDIGNIPLEVVLDFDAF